MKTITGGVCAAKGFTAAGVLLEMGVSPVDAPDEPARLCDAGL